MLPTKLRERPDGVTAFVLSDKGGGFRDTTFRGFVVDGQTKLADGDRLSSLLSTRASSAPKVSSAVGDMGVQTDSIVVGAALVSDGLRGISPDVAAGWQCGL
mmetsp:Transcript_109048/g.216570  ORF Transcript_109048/g.216570 Transcript_109048/m.216570 type:complete len:102 (+) Transcript_109048:936-1241(+)